MIDAHIHLERYAQEEQDYILRTVGESGVTGLVAVSMDDASCIRTRACALRSPQLVHPCYGFHPEQALPAEQEMDALFSWIVAHQDEMIAVGEVGLPYYTRMEVEARGEKLDYEPYVALLDRFIRLAKQLDKPIVLHAVYEDADIACVLLEKHAFKRAHFHWFKGAPTTIARMIANGYFISITPDVVYESEIQQLVRQFPLEQIMVETDGPWPFEGPFTGQPTHPAMMHAAIEQIAAIKQLPISHVHQTLLTNTLHFYRIPPRG